MKQVIQKFLRLTLLAFCALMALPSWADHMYVFCDNSSSGWGTPRIHYFNGNNGSSWETRPEMDQLTTGSNYYYKDIGNNPKFLFTNGGSSGNRNQTVDISVSDSDHPNFTIYKISYTNNDEYNKYSTTAATVYLGDTKMSGSGKTYTLSNVALDGDVKVSVKDNGGSTTLLTFGSSETLSGSGSVSLTEKGGDISVPAGHYDVTFDVDNLKLTFTKYYEEAWEVMVASSGSNDYTSYPVTIDGSTMTSDEFTIHNGDHFYLKHTKAGTSLSTTSYKTPKGDSGEPTYMTIDMQGSGSSTRVHWMSTDSGSGIEWQSGDALVQIHFQYTGDNPFYIYNTGNLIKDETLKAPTIEWNKNENLVTITVEEGATILWSERTTEVDQMDTWEEYTKTISLASGDKFTITAYAQMDEELSEPASLYVEYTPTLMAHHTYYIDLSHAEGFKPVQGELMIYDGQETVTANEIETDKLFSFVPTRNTAEITIYGEDDPDKKIVASAPKIEAETKLVVREYNSEEGCDYAWEPYTYVAQPVISKDDNSNLVTITCETEGATIWYTIDNREPYKDVSGQKYPEGGFYLPKGYDNFVRAYAFLADGTCSSQASEAYTYIPEFDTSKTYYIDASQVGWFKNNEYQSLAYVSGPMEGDATVVEWVAYKTYKYKFVPTEEHVTKAKIYRHLESANSNYKSSTYATLSAPSDETLNLIVLTGNNEVDGGYWSTYEAPKAATPEFSFENNVLTITSETSGATIYYTADGETVPTVSDAVAHGTTPVTYTLTEGQENVVIKAIAVAENYDNSEVATSEAYSYTEAPKKVFYVYNNGSWSSIRLWAWTVDADNKTSNVFDDWNNRPDIRDCKVDATHVNSGRSCTITSGYIGIKHVYKVEVDSEVTNIQFDKNSNNNSDQFKFAEGWENKIFCTKSTKMDGTLDITKWSTEIQEQVATPIIGISGNEITITTTSADTKIYYTIDDSTPTSSSTEYTGTFEITQDCTISAIAVDPDAVMADSEVATKSATYVKPNYTIYVVNNGNWGKVELAIWNTSGDMMDDNGNVDLLNFDSSKVKSGYSISVTKGTSSEYAVIYKISIDNSANSIRFGANYNQSHNPATYDGKIFFTSSQSFSTTSSDFNWTAGDAADELSGYYLIGDLNKWFNDGTYKDNSGNEHEYGYDPVKYGKVTDYEFTAVSSDDATLAGFCDRNSVTTDGWYKYTIDEHSALPNKLFGQFCVYKGNFASKKKTYEGESSTYDVTYYTPTWDSNRQQFAWSVDQQNEYKESSSKGLDVNKMMDLHSSSSNNKNISLVHNYYNYATLYFNPAQKKIYLYSSENDEDYVAWHDITIYYARLSFVDEASAKSGGTPSISINAESLNTNNYWADTESANGEMDFVYDEAGKTINGKTYNYYWEKKLAPGMEFPAGQVMTAKITLSNGDYDDSDFAITGSSVYLTDQIEIFYDTQGMKINGNDNITINSVECRIYGYSSDGSKIQVCGQNGKFQDADPTDDNCWSMLNRGCMTDSFTTINKDTKYDLYEPIGWEDLAADNSNADKCTTWSTWTETGTHIPVSPVNATKYIQFRIKYVNNAVNSRRRVNAAATTGTEETLYIPDYFETSRPSDGASDTEAAAYTWALQGTHTVIKNEGIETGIEEILDEEEAAEAVEGVEVETIYYNLQGQRVKNPDRGIYIRVHGNKATKVAL